MQRTRTEQAAIVEPIVASAAAVILAGLIGFLMTEAPQANDAAAAPPQTAALKGAVCSQHAWPHFEQRCQFDRRNPANAARTVRVLAVR